MNEAGASLRLRAEDAEDFRVVAACLQDALVPLGDMSFESAQGEFVVLANRFRWEAKSGERIHCAVHFTGVATVRRRGIDLRERGRILDLLTVTAEPGAVVLLFAGDLAVRLEGERIGCRLRDIGEPWPATGEPRHPDA
ncbi:MAG: DUF2948 family protein [Rhodospirillales bacterium]|nr:DUF2948 family protein [Rhodospirillales bacterium]